MEFTVDKKTLENAMTNIVSVAPAKAIKPILSSVLIECSDAVYLYATDMETSIRIKLEGASAQSPGKTAVDAKTLFEIAKNAPSAQLNIKQENEWIKLFEQCGFKYHSNVDLPTSWSLLFSK